MTAADGKTTFPVPSISTSEFNARLAEIAGRELTADEQKRADEMAAHAWTLRVVATELFGAELVDAHFAPRK